MSSFRADLHRLQLELFAANQKIINAAVTGYTAEFRRYEARYKHSIPRVYRAASLELLVRKSRAARVTLLGDYHTLRQSQRSFFRLLRAQPDDDAHVTLALEMLPAGHERALERYLAGLLTEARLLTQLRHAERWPFGGLESIRPALELARRRGYRVIGLDPDSPERLGLAARDRFAAAELARAHQARPRDRLFVLMGELHLADAHLPRQIARRVPGEILTVHQNPEKIWFAESEDGAAPEQEIYELEGGAFAWLSAPPVVCQQSFLTWLEESEEDGPGEEPDTEAGERRFRQSVQLIGRALGLPTRRALGRVEVVGPADLSFFSRLAEKKKFSRGELGQIRAHILSSESCYIPRTRTVYLATTSLNHAAEEAGHFLRHHCSGEGLDEPRSPVDAFYCRVMNEAVGFLASKLVNPRRKCVREDELRPGAQARGKGRSVAALSPQVAALVHAHKQLERGRHQPDLARVYGAPAAEFNAVTHVLGYMLGERLYVGLLRGKIKKREVRELFFEPFEDEGAALLLYMELAARTNGLRLPRRA